MAEYYRLQQKIRTLAQKNQWEGVERSYTELIGTGVLPEFEDYLWGAHSARAMGDLTGTLLRLKKCNRIREDEEVINWMADIEDHYGHTVLRGDTGKVELTIATMPFDPIQARAIEFAQAEIVRTGTYDGYLPAGEYHFGPFDVDIRPRVSGETIDVRSDDFIRALEKQKAKEARKNSKG